MLEYVIRCAGQRVNSIPTEGDREVATNFTEGSVDLEAGAIGTATFTLPPGHPWNEDGAFRTCDPSCEVTISERYADDSLGPEGREAELFRGWVVETSQDGDLMMRVECEGVLAYLKNTVVRPYACTATTDLPDGTNIVNEDPFRWLIEQHNRWAGPSYSFRVGRLCRTGPVEAGTDFKSTWDELNDKFCTGRDRFLNARTDDEGFRVVDLLDGGAGESTQAIVVGENVLEFSFGRHDRETVTAIVARGTSDDSPSSAAGDRIDRREFGLEGADVAPYRGRCSEVRVEGDRAVNWKMVDAYGYREERRDYDARTPDALAQMAFEDLDPLEIDERNVQSVDVTFLDLHTLNPRVQPIRLLDWVEVYIRADGMRRGDAKGRTIFHGWLPCTKMHIDLANPENSTYHLGDLEETLTRKSALRLGMLRRATGGLVRRADATPWNNDRIWNRTDDVEEEGERRDEEIREELNRATDDWSAHLDEETARWYESLDDARKEAAQGREELLKHMDEITGNISDTVDRNHRELLDGLADVAANSRRSFFGVCRTPGATQHKVVDLADLTRPGGETFALEKGVVVDIQFLYANEASTPQLSVANTGVGYIITNGSYAGVWQNSEVVRFLYDGEDWQCCGVDIYGRSVTVGHPSLANFYTNGSVAELRIGSESYWHAGMDGTRVGLLGDFHVDTGSSSISFERGTNELLRIGVKDGTSITAADVLLIDSDNNDSTILLSSLGPMMGFHENSFGVSGSTYITGSRYWVMASKIVDVSNSQYAWIAAGDIGGTYNLFGYAFSVTNGDPDAYDFFVEGTQVRSNQLVVKFDRTVNGRIRLNLLGVPVNTVIKD